MKRLSTALTICLALWLASANGQQPAGDAPYVPGELLVKFQSDAAQSRRDDALARQGARVLRSFAAFDLHHVESPRGRRIEDVIAALEANPDVVFAQPNYIRHTTQTAPPNDPLWLNGTLWGLLKIQAPGAWSSYTTGDGSVVIADIDTGINYNHPDLAANVWVNQGEIPGNGIDDDGDGYIDDVHGINVLTHSGDPMDDHGHGTHTAGTIAAVGNNGIGVVGVNWNAKVVACKFLNASGSGSDAGAIECFNYIVMLKQRSVNGVNVRVTSNSWGATRGCCIDQALQSAIDAAGAAGIVSVFAAGNNSGNDDTTPFDPASMPSTSIIAVAASDQADNRASFSNYGAGSVHLAAPGVSITSTYGGGYGSLSGTSMATPHVAGAAALVALLNPTLSPVSIKNLLMNNVDVLPQWASLVASGGRLNVLRAAAVIAGDHPPTVALTAPAAGNAGNAPAAITVSATAGDTDGTIASVEFRANGTTIGTATASPYSIAWSGVAAGNYSLTAVATDNIGARTTSAPVAVTVNARPMVVLTSPAGGNAGNAPATITVGATANDTDGTIASVAFFANGAPIGTATTSPYSLSWTNVAAGPYSLTAVATDNLGATRTSAAVAITVNAKPTVSLTAPANSSSFTTPGTVTVTATASDSDGTVTSVAFFANGAAIGTATTSPYSVSWTNPAVGSYSLTAVATDNVGATTTSNAVSVTVTAPPPSPPTAYWRLNEGSGGTASDSSGNNNTGTLVAAPSWTAGQVAGAIQLNGSTQDIVVPDSPSLSITGTGLTLAAWIYPTQAAAGGLIHKEQQYSLLRNADGSLTYADSVTWSYATIGGHGATPLNTWSHVAVTFDGSVIRFYVNGQPAGVVNRNGSLTDTANALHLGSYNGQAAWFAGKLDEAQVFNRTLTAPEIVTLAASGAGDTTPPAIATVAASSATQVAVTYTEAVNALSATSVNNYAITPGIAVLQAALQPDGKTVALTTTALSAGSYTLAVSNVQDLAANPIAPGTQATFSFTPAPTAAAYWRLNEGSGGTAGDSSGNNNTGTLVGAPGWTAGQVAGAIQLNGSTQDIVVPDSPSLSITGTGLTLAAWIYPTQAAAGGLIHKEQQYSLLRNADGSLTYADSVTWSYATIGGHGLTPLNTWSHVAVTFDGSAIRFYVNGQPAGVVNRSGSLTDTVNALHLGSYNGQAAWFAGKLDEVQVFNRTLSAQEIVSLQAGGGSDTTPPAIASVTASTATQVTVAFTEAVNALSATSVNNYAITPGIAVLQAALQPDGKTVALTTTALSAGSYTLAVSNVQDLAANPIPPGTQASFTYAPQPPAAAAYWRLDEGIGGVAGDSSGNGNTGTLVGAPSWTAGQMGGAIQLNGSTQDIVVPDSPSLSITGTALTLAAWIYPTQAAAGGVIHKDLQYSLVRNADGSLTYADSVTWSYATIGSHGLTPLNTWSHVAVTFDGSAIRFYVNGQPAGVVNRSGSLTDTANALHLGSYNGQVAWFAGKLDEVRVFNRTLSAQEIVSLQGAGADTTPPAIASVAASSATQVTVTYTEAVSALGATTMGNYGITPGISVLQAALQPDGKTVALTTTVLSAGSYTLAVSNVQDLAANPIAPGTQASFTYAPPPPAAAASWRLDESSGGVASDSSGNSNTGTLVGAPSWTVGQVGGAIQLNGSTQDIVAADSPSLSITGTGLTLTAWIYPTQAAAGGIIHKDLQYSLLRNADGSLTYADSVTWSYATIGGHGSTPLNTWSHVAVTFDGSMIRFYINGQPAGVVNRSGSLTDTANALHLGSYNGQAAWFAGKLDEVQVFNRALTPQEVAALAGGSSFEDSRALAGHQRSR